MINTTLDGYVWRVTLANGSEIGEYDENRLDGRGFLEVASQGIRVLEIISLSHPANSHSVLIPEGAEPVFVRRRPLHIDLNQGSQWTGKSAHCIGWRRDDQGAYLFVFEDGSTLLTNNLQAV